MSHYENCVDWDNDTPAVADPVNAPTHYNFYGLEAIRIIRDSMTEDEFRGYCMGNSLKHRLRAGKKDDVVQEINKALMYEQIYKDYI